MSRYKFAVSTSLLVFSLAGIARAQDPTYNVASDWATTYPNTTVLNSATTATWGAGGAWSAGELSFNWTNYSGQTNTLQTYYSATPTVASATDNSSTVHTYTYTVPFQAYQLNPGATIQQQIGAVSGNILAGHWKTAQGSTIGLNGSEVGVGTTTSGYLQEIAHVENVASRSTTAATGFTTNGFSNTTQIQDGASSNNTTLAEVPGVFYNYTTTDFKSSGGQGVADSNIPSGSGDNVVNLNPSIGPAYVGWTAPSAGTITSLSVNAWEMREGSTDNDEGFTSFYVATSAAATTNGFTSFLLAAVHGNAGLGESGAANATLTASVGTASYATVAPAGYTINNNASGVTWSASGIAVTAGEVLYFIADPTHGDPGSGGSQNHTWPGSSNPLALQTSLSFVPSPEPSSMLLLGLGGVGLAFAAWRKRRSATA